MIKITTIFALLLFASRAICGQIAITFDDAPTGESVGMTGEQRTRMLIGGLKKANVESALFFVLGNNVDANSSKRLSAYVDAGHELGNHSFSHISANQTTSQDFLNDVSKAHSLIKNVQTSLSFFRFPYLHGGDTPIKRTQLQAGIKEMGYQMGYVTVDNYDWYINSLYLAALEKGETIDLQALESLYVQILWDGIQFYDRLAIQYLGQSPKHVLLLHENDLAALFIPALVKKIRDSGWQIITPQIAYQEPLLAIKGRDLAFSKQGRVAALAKYLGAKESELRSRFENTEYLDSLFNTSQVILNK